MISLISTSNYDILQSNIHLTLQKSRNTAIYSSDYMQTLTHSSFNNLSTSDLSHNSGRYQRTDNFRCYIFWKALLIMVTLHYLIFEVDCTVQLLDGPGLFYTCTNRLNIEQFKITNRDQISTNSQILSVSPSYTDWSFTNSIIPDNYVSLSIQQMNIKVDSNNYLTFNIKNKTVYQTSILIYFGVCQSDGSCFTSATIRMLAVDYDMQINSALCSQVISNLFIQNQIMNNDTVQSTSDKDIYQFFKAYPPVTFYSQAKIFIYINSFILKKGTSNNKLRVTNSAGQYINSSPPQTVYKIKFSLEQSRYSDTFQVGFSIIIIRDLLFSDPSSPSSIYKIIVYSSSMLNNHQLIQQNYSSYAGYPFGQVLMYGMNNLFIQSNNFIYFTSTIESTRVFGSTSTNILNVNGVNDNIGMQWFIIQKQICLPPSRFYRIANNGTSSCSSSGCGDGYYIKNQYTCYECQNPTCKNCTSNSNTSCSDCDSTTRQLQNNSCNPRDGYYQNQLIKAGKCMDNCSACSNNDLYLLQICT